MPPSGSWSRIQIGRLGSARRASSALLRRTRPRRRRAWRPWSRPSRRRSGSALSSGLRTRIAHRRLLGDRLLGRERGVGDLERGRCPRARWRPGDSPPPQPETAASAAISSGMSEGPARRARTYHRPTRRTPDERAARVDACSGLMRRCGRGITFTPLTSGPSGAPRSRGRASWSEASPIARSYRRRACSKKWAT